MALFHRRENTNDKAPLYTLGNQKTVLVVGLGNEGKEYTGTRHNIGFACLDYFADHEDFPAWIEKVDLKCQLTKQLIGDTSVILIKPTTYMNESGQAVSAVQRFYKISAAQTLVIHDELALPFGQLRTRTGGSHAGNNGIKSILKFCDDNFTRIRIGIDNEKSKQMDTSDFVLAKFLGEERDRARKIETEVSSMISEFVAQGAIDHDTRIITD